MKTQIHIPKAVFAVLPFLLLSACETDTPPPMRTTTTTTETTSVRGPYSSIVPDGTSTTETTRTESPNGTTETRIYH